jgi:glycosyltransferase involved in cell wall biosynthesis
MVVLSPYPWDPRPRRAAHALAQQGMDVDFICISGGKKPRHEKIDGIEIFRVPIIRHRRGKFTYLYEYSAFTAAATIFFAVRSLWRHYDLIYVNNMPDVLIVSALLPKILGAKVILDLHDPMPELISTIFSDSERSLTLRIVKWLEKWSIRQADEVIVPNIACQRLFSTRSCPSERSTVVMNTPEEDVFPFCPVYHPMGTENSNRPFILMYHGSLLERNGADLAVQALAHIRDKIPTAQLYIYGQETDFLHKVLQSVRELRLEDRVRYFGQRTHHQIVEAIHNCDVGIIPNQRNAFAEITTPTRIFEYLVLGKPVIAPRTLGIQDYFTEDSLLFFCAGDALDLSQRIEFAASNPIETRTITERGQRVYSAHTWEHERKNLINLVAKVVAEVR